MSTPRARVLPPITRFVVASHTLEGDREEPDVAPEPWVHGESSCRECGYPMTIHAPTGDVRHGYCPACGAELEFLGIEVAGLEATGTDR